MAGIHPDPAGRVSTLEVGVVRRVGLPVSSNDVTVKSLSGTLPRGLESWREGEREKRAREGREREQSERGKREREREMKERQVACV